MNTHNIHYRHNIQCFGSGGSTLVFGHGFGCDQTMWRFLAPAFADRYRIVLFDLLGSGYSDAADYDPKRYATLHAHADDLIRIVEATSDGPVIYIGHSVNAMIGMLAAIKAPALFAAQVMVSPSPCYLNDGDYVGGANADDIDALLRLMDDNWLKWAARMGPVIMGAPDRPELQEELTASFCRVDPKIAKHFGRVTFLSDHRADLAASRIPTLILQSTDDLIAPVEVGEYMQTHMANSTLALVDNIGHCPHMSAPSRSAALIETFLAGLPQPLAAVQA